MYLPILKLAKELVNSKGRDVNMSDGTEEKQLPSGSSENDEHQDSNEVCIILFINLRIETLFFILKENFSIIYYYFFILFY